MSENQGRPPPPTPTEVLRELRQKLDGIDEDLVRLIASRMETVGLIIAEKQGRTAGIRDAKREHEVLTRVEALARGAGISAPLARKIFSELISHSVSRQASTLTGLGPEAGPLRVAYVGSPYTFNHLAAQKFASELDEVAEFVGQASIKDAVAALEADAVELAFLNIESTAAGSINQVYDVLREKDLAHRGGGDHQGRPLPVRAWRRSRCSAHRARAVPPPGPRAVLACSWTRCPNAKAVPAVDTAEAMRLCAERQRPHSCWPSAPRRRRRRTA